MIHHMDTTSSISLNIDQSDDLSNSKLAINFRFLQYGDQIEAKTLCNDWFPLTYPDHWYDDIVENKKYFSLAACDTSTQRIIGLLIANILPLANCHRNDQRILHRKFPLNTSVCYILVLGVVKEYRRQGIAGLLLENLLQKLHSNDTCKAIYLHVLHSNNQAIKFYQSKLFQSRLHLRYYYLIQGQYFDAYCFARYINGGYPPLTVMDFLSNIWTYLTQTNPCRLLNTLRYILTFKYYQRPLAYKQLSRII